MEFGLGEMAVPEVHTHVPRKEVVGGNGLTPQPPVSGYITGGYHSFIEGRSWIDPKNPEVVEGAGLASRQENACQDSRTAV